MGTALYPQFGSMQGARGSGGPNLQEPLLLARSAHQEAMLLVQELHLAQDSLDPLRPSGTVARRVPQDAGAPHAHGAV